jgi:Acetyltransferase (GNAT) domain
MMEPHVYTTETMADWRLALDRFRPSCRDVYYGPAYYRSWMDHEAAEPVCLHVIADGIDFLYPFFRKVILDAAGSWRGYDIFSAYGYGGMIASVPVAAVPAETREKVNRVVDDWCAQTGVIAEFVRQNPLFCGPRGPLRRAENAIVRRNVYRRYADGRAIASTSARRNVRKARRNGLKAVVDTDLATVDHFNRLYAETAVRVGMRPYYFFGAAYTTAVSRWLGNSAMLVNIEKDAEVVAASLVMKEGPYTTYHLSGSAAGHRKYYPNDLLLATLVDMGDNGPSSVLSLGGGLGSGPDDALFAFKNRFGNETCPVTVGKNVHDTLAYGRLCDAWAKQYPHLREPYGHFFLKYRMTQ